VDERSGSPPSGSPLGSGSPPSALVLAALPIAVVVSETAIALVDRVAISNQSDYQQPPVRPLNNRLAGTGVVRRDRLAGCCFRLPPALPLVRRCSTGIRDIA
jgi:hypothetical protein